MKRAASDYVLHRDRCSGPITVRRVTDRASGVLLGEVVRAPDTADHRTAAGRWIAYVSNDDGTIDDEGSAEDFCTVGEAVAFLRAELRWQATAETRTPIVQDDPDGHG